MKKEWSQTMKRMTSLIAALLCAVTVSSAAAAEFVPSIGYKDGPEVIEAILHPVEVTVGGEEVTDCVVLTSILAAQEKTTDIYQSARDLLIQVYGRMEEEGIVLPLEDGDYVVRELVDISFKKTPCIEAEHTHEDELEEEGIVLTAVLDLGVSADEKVVILSYRDGVWTEAVSTVNNGDGTVTCVLEHFCPVAICVAAESADVPPVATGDSGLNLWAALLSAACAGVVVLAVFRRKCEA